MTTAYTTLLGLALPVQGELQGTWGDEVNNYITNYLDAAVAGTQTISGSQTAVTLSKTTGSSLSQAGSGATGSSQYFVINCTGNPAGTLTITAPAASKAYLIINATSTTQDVKIVGAGPTTGVTLVSGERAIVSWNGSDFVKVANFGGVGSFTTISATTGNITTVNSTTVDTTNIEVTNIKAKDGTASASIADSTGVMSLVANPVLSGGTANGVLYLDGSKVATSGSALTFDGSVLVSGTGIRANSYMELRSNTSVLYWENAANTLYWAQKLTGSDFAWDYFNGVSVAEQMRLTSTGLGIGTSSPGGKLDVKQTTDTSLGGIYVRATDNNAAVISRLTTGNLVVRNGGIDSLFLDSSGNLGIGTTSPSSFDGTTKLVVGTGSGAPAITLYGGNATYSSLNFADGVTGNEKYRGFIEYDHASDAMRVGTSGATKATLDSSGNLGLGVTPSAWGGGYTGFQLRNSFSLWAANGTSAYLSRNVYYDGSSRKYVFTGAAAEYEMGAGTHVWYTAASGTAGNAISFTQAMTLDASGNLGIGTSSPNQKLDIAGSVQIRDSGTHYLNNSDNTNQYYWQNIGATGANNATLILSRTNAGETLRVDSSGNLGLGVTPSAWNSDYKVIQMGPTGSIYGRVGNNEIALFQNLYRDTSGNFKFLQNGYGASFAFLTGGGAAWYNWGNNVSGAGAAASSTQAMTLDASGNLGVGSTSPSGTAGYRYITLLDGSSGSALSFRKSTGVEYGSIFATASDNSLNIYSTLSGPLILGTNGSERARITSGGDLGVGTSSPATKINAVGDIRSTSIASNSYVQLAGGNSDGSSIQLNRDGSATQNAYFAQYQGSLFIKNLDSGPVIFTTTTSDTERARLTSAGA